MFLFILISGLVVWGVGDVLRNRKNNKIAKVGNMEITNTELERATNQSIRQISDDMQDDVKTKIINYIKVSGLKYLINEKLLQNELEKLKIDVSAEEILKNEYLSIPNFTKQALESYIRNEGGEKFFLEKITNEKKSAFLQNALTALVPYPDNGYDMLYKFEKQTRDIKLISIAPDIISEVPNPTDAELLEFYGKNKQKFKAPELRSISYLVIDKSSVENDLVKNEEGEEVDYSQAFNKITSEVLDAVAEEKPFDEIAKDLNLKLVILKNITVDGKNQNGENVENLPKIEGVLEGVFGLDEGIASDIFENEEGNLFVIAKVDSIKTSRVKAIDEVKASLKEFWTENKKSELFNKKVDEIHKNLISEKTSFNELSENGNIKVKKIKNIYRDYPELPQNLVKDIFELNIENYSNPILSNNGRMLIAKIIKIDEPKKIDELKKLEIKTNIQEQLQQEILTAYLSYLSTKYKIDSSVYNINGDE
jgi:peptidyl-prolyl cis-trans isomerase D